MYIYLMGIEFSRSSSCGLSGLVYTQSPAEYIVLMMGDGPRALRR